MINIIPIGPDCHVAIALRVAKIRKYAYPWDWAKDVKISEIVTVLQAGTQFDVQSWFRFSNLLMYLPHDVTGDTHGIIENEFEGVTMMEKYKRRFNRFFLHVQEPGVILLRFGMADTSDLNQLQQLLPAAKIIHLPDGHGSKSVTISTLQTLCTADWKSKLLRCYGETKAAYPIAKTTLLNEIAEQDKDDTEFQNKMMEFQQDGSTTGGKHWFQNEQEFFAFVRGDLQIDYTFL